VFSVFGVFSVLCFAVVACVGLDCELSVFPCFVWFGVFFFAVWTLSHNCHMLCFCLRYLKRLYVLVCLGVLFSFRSSVMLLNCSSADWRFSIAE